MSLEFQAKLICDGCGKQYVKVLEMDIRITCLYWDLTDEAVKQGWKYDWRDGEKTACPACADKPMKPLSRKKVK